MGVEVGVKTLNLSIFFSLLLVGQQPAYDPENLYQIYDVIISIDLVQSMQIEEKPSPKYATCLDKVEDAHCVYHSGKFQCIPCIATWQRYISMNMEQGIQFACLDQNQIIRCQNHIASYMHILHLSWMNPNITKDTRTHGQCLYS